MFLVVNLYLAKDKCLRPYFLLMTYGFVSEQSWLPQLTKVVGKLDRAGQINSVPQQLPEHSEELDPEKPPRYEPDPLREVLPHQPQVRPQ